MAKILILTILICINYFPVNALEIPENDRINHWVKEFTGKRKSFFQNSIFRSGLYRPIIKSIFRDEGLPEDLSWLPLVESGFDCSGKSKANAAGCWQFMNKTGESYDLKNGTWTDQRYDFNRSTVAAAKYLKKLHKIFGDWDLALAAYNWGLGNVRKAIKKKGKNYWNLDLPEETMNYVPEFYAAIKISRDLEKYNLKEPINELVIVRLRTGSHSLKYIAGSILRIDYKEFAKLNPGYKIGYTAPGESATIYLMSNWDVSLLRGFGLLAKKNPLKIN